ncbi:NAD(P)-dependent alcohol dehydrogenase [Cohnella faecalis]|uniref:NAD(P)-dependent alcohol dehydrogenase n=1 Tax=Cohnella faecalis TaxID=2315694 RepID=A0A398CKI1_9BACL|nr:NAD(P)-dependent alcohol dehydrogenase [Cohnella faecalis]RIE00191.1 NAD(P)-dependent alcohol dehydrogenase [Cohnella faecalis]
MSQTIKLPETMKAAVMTGTRQIRMEDHPIPKPRANEALIKVMAVGVCGSDIHYYEHGRIGRYVVEGPFVLGHECAGEVVAIGENVTRVAVGDRVAVEPGVTCGTCSACKAGRYNLCPDVQFLATPPVDGAFVQYMTHREDFLFEIPTTMSYETAALVEPFSVGIHAARRAGVQPGSAVVIMGMGPVGLMAVIAVKAFGAGTIIVADLEEKRLNAARQLGATHAIQVNRDDAAAIIEELTGGIGADAAFETAGNDRALLSALKSLRRGGALAIVGLPPQGDIPLPIPFIVDNELDIFGVFRYANTYPDGIRFLSSGMTDLDAIITDRFPLAETWAAMERALTSKSDTLKVIVYPNGTD